MNKISSIPQDKLAHYFVGSVIGLSVVFIGIWAMALVGAAAIGKELYDSTGKGTVDPYDALWTMLGGLVPILVFLVGK